MLTIENDPMSSEANLEPIYEILLDFLIRNQQYKPTLVDFFITKISSLRHPQAENGKFFPGLAIAYCMHVLRWPEIYNFAMSENRDFYSKKMQRGMTDILNAYDDDWEDKDFYRRFT